MHEEMMVEFANKELDFGALSKMAQDDPEGFDKVKRRLTQALIRRARTSSQGTLLDLQKKLDVLAKQIPEPYIGILSLTSHLGSDFAKLDWQLTELRNKYSSDAVSLRRIAAG